MATFAHNRRQLADPPRRVSGPRACWPARCGRRRWLSPRPRPNCSRRSPRESGSCCKPRPRLPGCHGIINPLGFTLEHFDAVGRFREKDNGKPVDASGELPHPRRQAREAQRRPRTGRIPGRQRGIADRVRRAVVPLFGQQPIRAYGPDELADLRQSFIASGYNIRKLVVETWPSRRCCRGRVRADTAQPIGIAAISEQIRKSPAPER